MTMRPLADLIGPIPQAVVVDIGASPLEGPPRHQSMLDRGQVCVVGFEPDARAFAALPQTAGCRFLPLALGDGQRRTLYECALSQMTSLFEPDPAVLGLYQGFPEWGRVTATRTVDTVRLDDALAGEAVDLVKIDVQGAELLVLENGRDVLAQTTIVEAETNFLPLYKGQPLFAEIELFLRAQGFCLHRFVESDHRLLLPLQDTRSAYAQGTQLLWSNAVFIRDFARQDALPADKLRKMAALLHEIYGSTDLIMRLLWVHDRRFGTRFTDAFVAEINRDSAAS